jgi:hypothetical protein
MFNLLDDTLKGMLDDASVNAVFPALYNADVSFITPDKTYAPQQETLNLFFYEARENRELRVVTPIVEQVNGMTVTRKPPLRVVCSYMVTGWSKKSGADKVDAEHNLLGQALNWLSRFPVIPPQFVQAAGLPGQDIDPPTLVAQLDAVKNVGEFWSALGIAPRPFFDLVVTLSMDLQQAVQNFMVTTVGTTYRNASGTSAEELMIIGGTVRDNAGNAVSQAWVRLDPAGAIQVADASGRFIFMNVRRGTGYSLQALAPGHAQPAILGNFEIPSLSGNYDLQFT